MNRNTLITLVNALLSETIDRVDREILYTALNNLEEKQMLEDHPDPTPKMMETARQNRLRGIKMYYDTHRDCNLKVAKLKIDQFL